MNVGCLGCPAALVLAKLVFDRLTQAKLVEGGRALNVAAVKEQVFAVRRSTLGQNEAEAPVADQSFDDSLCHCFSSSYSAHTDRRSGPVVPNSWRMEASVSLD